MMLARAPVASRLTSTVSPLRPSLLPCRPVVLRRFKEGETEEDLKSQLEQDPLKRIVNQQGVPKSLPEIQEAMRASGQRPRDLAPTVSFIQPFFSRGREITAGRIAMVGFFMACVWETILPGHPGIYDQISYATGLSHNAITIGFLLLVAHNAIAALAPWSPTYSTQNLMDVAQRPTGPPAVFVSPLNIQKFFGISGWGFTKKNELFHGRLAMLGFAAALINEVRLGGLGPLAQVAYYFNTVPDNMFYDTISRGFGVFAISAVLLAYVFGKPGPQAVEEDKDIYM